MRETLKNISIFFPAYNEEKNIASTVAQADAIAKKIAAKYEIIVVNDGSADHTARIVESLAKENPNIRLVNHDGNKGYGAAVWSGIKAARYDWVFFTDADLQFDISELEKLVEHTDTHQVIIGYRAPRRDPFLRLVNAFGWNILNRIFFGLRVRDIDCAFKLFDRQVVSSLPVQSRGAMMSAELLIRLSRRGIKFKQVPVTHLPRRAGVATGAKPAVIIRAFKEMYSLYKGELGREYVSAYIQAIKFLMVGVLNTAVDVLAYIGLTRSVLFFSDKFVAAKILSFFLGTICSFIMNRNFTFKSRIPVTLKSLVKFYSVIGFGVVINAGAMYVFHTRLGLNDLVSVGIATVLTFVWSFTLSKLWIFNKQMARKQITLEGARS